MRQFRQSGTPDLKRTNALVRQHIKKAQKRAETLLNRTPRTPTLLSSLEAAREAIDQAYGLMPLHRLTMVSASLEEVYDRVETNAMFGHRSNGDVTVAIQRIYRDLSVILNDLGRKPKKKQDTSEIDKFLEKMEGRGWKVSKKDDTEGHDFDGFDRSIRHLRKVAINRDNLLDDEDFGFIRAPVVLAHNKPIPETTLVDWTQQPFGMDVHIVFGSYVVLNDIMFLGVRPELVTDEDNKGRLRIRTHKFVDIANEVDADAGSHVVRRPNRIHNHYYCPIFSPRYQKYFRSWNIVAD